MNEFEVSIIINRPPQDVFNAITDLSKQHLWQNNVESVEWTSNGSTGVGSTMNAVGKFLGRKIETGAEVTVWDPPQRLAWKGVNGPYPIEVDSTFEPYGEGTRFTSVVRAEFGGFFKLAEGLAGKQIQKQIAANYETLKLMMESDQL